MESSTSDAPMPLRVGFFAAHFIIAQAILFGAVVFIAYIVQDAVLGEEAFSDIGSHPLLMAGIGAGVLGLIASRVSDNLQSRRWGRHVAPEAYRILTLELALLTLASGTLFLVGMIQPQLLEGMPPLFEELGLDLTYGPHYLAAAFIFALGAGVANMSAILSRQRTELDE